MQVFYNRSMVYCDGIIDKTFAWKRYFFCVSQLTTLKMVRITEELIRKKSEHNEGLITTLEELSLHQEDVEKIEHINNWCKGIQILYLQANLIAKIENLNKLKKLQYLNLAINNIEKIENLQGCESLEKLDLTLNFIGDLESVCSLKKNIHLKHLYLTGNPCCDYKGYKKYIISVLPQIETLDCREIIRSERLKALQNFEETEKQIKQQQTEYQFQRNQQRARFKTEELDDETFWRTPSENSPETRVEIAKRARRPQEKQDVAKEKKTVKLFNKDGRPLNVNQAKVDFQFNDDNPEKFVLDVAVYKYLDTSLIEVDVQPIFVKIVIKGKVFQFVLPEEVAADRSIAQRSQTTGHLVISMPKANFKITSKLKKDTEKVKKPQKTQFLEIEKQEKFDFGSIVLETNSEIPPLEYC